LDGGELGGEVLPEVGRALDADLDDLGELAFGLGVVEGGHEFGIAPGEDAASAGIAEFFRDLALFEVMGEGGKLGESIPGGRDGERFSAKPETVTRIPAGWEERTPMCRYMGQ